MKNLVTIFREVVEFATSVTYVRKGCFFNIAAASSGTVPIVVNGTVPIVAIGTLPYVDRGTVPIVASEKVVSPKIILGSCPKIIFFSDWL